MTLKIVSINGNIASGKSTLLKMLKQEGYNVYLEGLNRGKWGNVLELYYKNPKRYGFLFQMKVLADMKQTYESIRGLSDPGDEVDKKEQYVFIERSCIDCLAFTHVIYQNGDMSEEEYRTFIALYELLYDPPTIILPLKLSPVICFERCKARGRECEKTVSLKYLETVQKNTERVMTGDNQIKIINLDVCGKTTREIVSMVEQSLSLPSSTAHGVPPTYKVPP